MITASFFNNNSISIGKPVKPLVAMTGEISLTGKVSLLLLVDASGYRALTVYTINVGDALMYLRSFQIQ
jgi:hypothetical protein